MHAPSAAQNLRMCAEIQNGETASQTYRSPDNSARRRRPPGSSRLQANKHRAGASSPEARCFGPGSSEKRTEAEGSVFPRPFTCVPEVFGAEHFRNCWATSASTQLPRLRRNGAQLRISGSIFSSRKLGACSGHCTLQRAALTRLVSWTRYHAAVPISTNKSQQSAAATIGHWEPVEAAVPAAILDSRRRPAFARLASDAHSTALRAGSATTGLKISFAKQDTPGPSCPRKQERNGIASNVVPPGDL